MVSRYMDSVPFLQSQRLVEGYVWTLRSGLAAPHDAAACIAPGWIYIGTLPDGTILVAGPPTLPPGLSGITLVPWTVQLYNDAARTIPLAFLEEAPGRYVQLESFDIGLDGDAAPDQPTFCKFLIGTTNAQTHLCPD